MPLNVQAIRLGDRIKYEKTSDEAAYFEQVQKQAARYHDRIVGPATGGCQFYRADETGDAKLTQEKTNHEQAASVHFPSA